MILLLSGFCHVRINCVTCCIEIMFVPELPASTFPSRVNGCTSAPSAATSMSSTSRLFNFLGILSIGTKRSSCKFSSIFFLYSREPTNVRNHYLLPPPTQFRYMVHMHTRGKNLNEIDCDTVPNPFAHHLSSFRVYLLDMFHIHAPLRLE